MEDVASSWMNQTLFAMVPFNALLDILVSTTNVQDAKELPLEVTEGVA